MEADRLNFKFIALAAAALAVPGGLAVAILRPGYFADWTYLAALLGLEVLAVCAWFYDQLFFPALLFAFLWAGVDLPLSGLWQAARWVVLGVGAFLGFILWLRARRLYLNAFHYFFLAGIFAALASVADSSFPRIALLKVLSLFLLFVYSATGARLAITARLKNFVPGLLLGCEIAVWISAAAYWGIAPALFGNQNSMGAIMGVAVFPPLLWGVLVAKPRGERPRRLLALAVCAALLYSSMARAGMLAAIASGGMLLICTRRDKLLLACSLALAVLAAGTSMFAPAKVEEVTSSVLYKQGPQRDGVLQSRRSVWDRTVTGIQEHPWLGTGFGTSGEGEVWNRLFVATSSQVNREHGSSYLEMMEWTGLLGFLPFGAVLVLLLRQVWRVSLWMRSTRSALHPAVPLAAIVIAGLVHAAFEDWLLAVGYYLTVLFWPVAFSLMDLLPGRVLAPVVAGPVNVVKPRLSALADVEG